MQAAGAISRTKKTEIVANLTEKLQSSTLVFGMEYQGIGVSFFPHESSFASSVPITGGTVNCVAEMRKRIVQ